MRRTFLPFGLLGAMILCAGAILALLALRASPALRASLLPGAPRTAASADSTEVAAQVHLLAGLLGISLDAGSLDQYGDDLEGYASLRAQTAFIAEQFDGQATRIPSISPVPGGTITSPYARRRYHPIRHEVAPHYGIDIAAPTGTPIRATADGTVSKVANTPSYGNAVDIDHGNGFITRYAHASKILVVAGQSVRRGDVIALVGTSGDATGPNLHYEIFNNGWSLDPIRFILSGGTSVADEPSTLEARQ